VQRFNLFNRAALEALRALPFGPGEDCVIVCNDWHTALLPVLLKVRLDTQSTGSMYGNTKMCHSVQRLAHFAAACAAQGAVIHAYQEHTTGEQEQPGQR